jgi:hypothetical protein
MTGAGTKFGAEGDHFARRFSAAWGPRAETPLELARRVKAMCGRLVETAPEHRDVWPLFAMRAIRPGVDPGPLLDIPDEDLAKLIDRKARFDPPQLPAPVGPEGYRMVLSANRAPPDPRSIGMSVSAGVYEEGVNENRVEVTYHLANPVWQDPSAGARVVEIIAETFSPEWVCVSAFIQSREERGKGHRRPWIAWSAPASEVPPYWTEHGGPPSEVRPAFGGELRIWP